MGKKKSSASKKQQSLAAAVEEAEQDVDELKLNDETKSEGATKKTKENGKKGAGKKSKVEEKTEEEEFEFDYTGGENTTEDNDQSNTQGLFYVFFCLLYHIAIILINILNSARLSKK